MYIKHSEAAADSLVVHQRLRQHVLGNLGRRPSCEDNMLWCRMADDIDMTHDSICSAVPIEAPQNRFEVLSSKLICRWYTIPISDVLASPKKQELRSGILAQLEYPVLSQVLGLPFLWTQTNCDSKSPSQIHTHVDTAKLMPSMK